MKALQQYFYTVLLVFQYFVHWKNQTRTAGPQTIPTKGKWNLRLFFQFDSGRWSELFFKYRKKKKRVSGAYFNLQPTN